MLGCCNGVERGGFATMVLMPGYRNGFDFMVFLPSCTVADCGNSVEIMFLPAWCLVPGCSNGVAVIYKYQHIHINCITF